jgi:SAM-dependent methyltransferase
VDAGFQALGVDLSAAMLRIARKVVPEAKFVRSSLWSMDLPGGPGETVAVTAVGEALSYATDAGAGLPGLRDLLAAIHGALTPGGLLLFDVAGPGRGGPDGHQERTFASGPTLLLLDEREDRANGVLTRALTTFTMLGPRFRRSDETHRLVLYEPERIELLLAETGFAWDRLAGYEGTELLPGWHVFLARKQFVS